ncbi:hypothetical protein Tco_0200789 [Tanacetum coccineum]
MISNQSKIRVRGQRLIPSTFIQPTSTDKEKVENGSKKRAKISLSDFLDKKLQKMESIVKIYGNKQEQERKKYHSKQLAICPGKKQNSRPKIKIHNGKKPSFICKEASVQKS